jgi:hypothetical protein
MQEMDYYLIQYGNLFKIKCTLSKWKTKVLIKISQSVIHSELNQLSGHIMILAIDITSPFYNSRFNQLYVVFSAFNQQFNKEKLTF